MNCALARVKLMLKKEFETDPFVYKTILLLQVISKNLENLVPPEGIIFSIERYSL